MEAPEGFRNSDEDRFSESQVIRASVQPLKRIMCLFSCSSKGALKKNLFFYKESSVEDVQDLGQMEMPEEEEEAAEEHGKEKGDEQHGEKNLSVKGGVVIHVTTELQIC